MKKETYDYLRELNKVIEILTSSDDFNYQIEKIAKNIVKATDENKITVIFGNGGSASDAQHFCAELVGKYKRDDRRPFSALALNTDTSFMTAWSNDFCFSSIFKRQIEALSNSIGLSIGLSTSGRSINVLEGLKESEKYGAKTFLITGIDCPQYDYVTEIIRLPSSETSVIQTLTQVMYHLICLKLEKN